MTRPTRKNPAAVALARRRWKGTTPADRQAATLSALAARLAQLAVMTPEQLSAHGKLMRAARTAKAASKRKAAEE